MRTFYTSDLHFNHVAILNYCQRPFKDVADMNEALIHNWNSVVAPGDEVYVIGDFALGDRSKIPEIRAKLNGKITLVAGNHDYKKSLKFFDAALHCLILEGPTALYMRHVPDFAFARDNPGCVVLCGHVHKSWRRLGNLINVGADVWGYTPRTLEELMQAEDQSEDPAIKAEEDFRKNIWTMLEQGIDQKAILATYANGGGARSVDTIIRDFFLTKNPGKHIR